MGAGRGTPVGALAELLAGALNANLGGRDHAPIACEQQVIRWAIDLLGFPIEASGLLLTGTSMAKFHCGADRPDGSTRHRNAPARLGRSAPFRLCLCRCP